MRSLPISLGLLLAPLLLAACESTHPVPQMGPQSARYITSSWRKAFREDVSTAERAAAGREAAALARAEARGRAAEAAATAAEESRRAALAAAPAAPYEEVVEVEMVPYVEPAAPARPPIPAQAPTSPAPAPTSHAPLGAAAAATTADAKPKGLPEPLRWAKRDHDNLGSRSPALPASQRRFVRLRLTELDGTPVKAREVRPVLRAIVGVQDAVLNETTGTAVVVVDPSLAASTVVERLKGRYRATIVR